MDVMIDLETLGTRPDAKILQIGAVFFEAKPRGKILNNKPFNKYCKIQDDLGSEDHDTLAFWFGQIAGNKAHPMVLGLVEKAELMNDVLADLLAWPLEFGVTWGEVDTVWAKPSNFDLPILASAFNKFGIEAPWDHRSTRCLRTLLSVTGEPAVDWSGLTHHDALDDAIGQAMTVQNAMGLLVR
jgi:exodeoxyribonuclease VIII